MKKPISFALIGRSGSGKGTQADLLIKHFGNLFYVQTGGLLRELAKLDTLAGKSAKQIMQEGKLFPDFMIIGLWMRELNVNIKEEQGVLFDGAFRRLVEAEQADAYFNFLGREGTLIPILIDISKQEAFDRLTKRRICKDCKKIIPFVGEYKTMEKCDKCGGELMARPDDNPAAIENRLAYFDNEVLEVLDYYKKDGRLITINGEQSIEKVFEDILKTFGARIYQQNGEWWIVRVDEFREELTCRKWTVNRPVNNSFVLSETKLTTFLVGKPSYSSSTGGLIVNNSPSLDILPAWKEFNIIQELKKKESIFKNSFFEDWENDYLPNTTGRLQTSFFIKDWIEPYEGFAKRHIDSEGNSFVQLEPEYTGLGLKQIISDVENLDLYAIKQKLKFKFEFDIIQTVFQTTGAISYETKIETAKFAIMIKIEGLPFDYYLVPDTTSDYGFSWSTTREIIEVGNIDVSYYGGRYNRNGRVNFDWKTFEFVAPGFKSDGDLIIEILPAYRDIWTNVTSTKNIRLRLNEVSCKIVDINKIEFSEESKINTVVNSNNIYKPDDIEVLLGDLQDIPNNIHIWSNFLAKDDGDHTVDWKEKGGTTKLPILNILANDIVKRVGKPQFKLSVPILSPVIEFDSCIVDFLVPLVSGKKYLCNSASKNYQTGIFQGEYIEFSEWENLIWILAEGTWNDYGVWLDTETWNDDDSDLIEFDLIRDDEILPKIWNITTLVGIANGDTIDKLLPDSNLIFGDFLYEDTIGNEIDSVPYTFTGTVLAFRSSLTKNQSYSTYFNATISGDKKIIKINVNL